MVNGARFSQDGSRIVTWSRGFQGSGRYAARLWNSASGVELGPPLYHEDIVEGARFSQDESRILTWSFDGTARLWDSASGTPLTPPLPHDPAVGQPPIDPQETRLRTWTKGGGLRVWDLTIDEDWPIAKVPLRVEVETGSTLNKADEARALSALEWECNRCKYDAIRRDLERITDAEWAESERRCRALDC